MSLKQIASLHQKMELSKFLPAVLQAETLGHQTKMTYDYLLLKLFLF